MTVIQGRFEWDKSKDLANIKKHGFSFREILPVFDDPYFYERYDYTHSTLDDERLIGIGAICGLLIVTACYTERERIRIITARRATENEEKDYYEQRKTFDS